MMQSEEPGLGAVQQCAEPSAVKQLAVPKGHRQVGDGAESGATVQVQLQSNIFRMLFFFVVVVCFLAGGLARGRLLDI